MASQNAADDGRILDIRKFLVTTKKIETTRAAMALFRSAHLPHESPLCCRTIRLPPGLHDW